MSDELRRGAPELYQAVLAEATPRTADGSPANGANASGDAATNMAAGGASASPVDPYALALPDDDDDVATIPRGRRGAGRRASHSVEISILPNLEQMNEGTLSYVTGLLTQLEWSLVRRSGAYPPLGLVHTACYRTHRR